MRSLFEEFDSRLATPHSYYAVVDRKDQPIILYNVVNDSDFTERIPEKSTSGRVFLGKNTCRVGDDRRYSLVPARAQIGVLTRDVAIIETDNPDYLIIDTTRVLDDVFVLRLPGEQEDNSIKQTDDRFVVVCQTLDCHRSLTGAEEYDAFVTSGGYPKCTGYYPPVVFDKSRKKYYSDEDFWKTLSFLL